MPKRMKRLTEIEKVRAELSWRIAEWCIGKGATEFSLRLMSVQTTTPRAVEDIQRELRSFFVKIEKREVTFSVTHEEIPLWRLCATSLSVLKRQMPNGAFAHNMTGEDWIEDLVIYRNKNLLFGTLSHEQCAFICASESECEEIQAMGLELRD
jgi:hypothetical protein